MLFAVVPFDAAELGGAELVEVVCVVPGDLPKIGSAVVVGTSTVMVVVMAAAVLVMVGGGYLEEQ